MIIFFFIKKILLIFKMIFSYTSFQSVPSYSITFFFFFFINFFSLLFFNFFF